MAGKQLASSVTARQANVNQFEPSRVQPAWSIGLGGEFGRSGNALAFLGDDAVCAYLDRVGQVIVISEDGHDRTALARVATVAFDFVTVQPSYYYSITQLESAHPSQLLNLRTA
jgi:hypothetical protein